MSRDEPKSKPQGPPIAILADDGDAWSLSIVLYPASGPTLELVVGQRIVYAEGWRGLGEIAHQLVNLEPPRAR